MALLTKAQARSKLRGLLRDEDGDNFSTTYVDQRLTAALRNLVGNELAAVASDFFFTRRVLTGLTDALDQGTVGTQGVNELYPLPEDLKKLRFIYRADLAGEPILWGQRSEEQAAHRFGGVLQGTITIEGSGTYRSPAFHSGQSAAIEGNKFRVIPGPQSTSEKFGVAFERASAMPTGENDFMDLQDEFEEAWLLQTAYEVLMLEGDPQAENLRLLAWGDPRSFGDTGAIGRAKKAARERTVGNLTLGRVRFG